MHNDQSQQIEEQTDFDRLQSSDRKLRSKNLLFDKTNSPAKSPNKNFNLLSIGLNEVNMIQIHSTFEKNMKSPAN